MEIIAIESKAFATLVEKIEGIAAYVEASGTKEREQWPVADKKGTRKAGLYRTNRIIAYSICGRKIRYRRTDVEQFHERWIRETPDKLVDRMIEAYPLHQCKSRSYGKKRGNTGKNR